ncbi:MAG: hypothetical protein FP826_01455 [Sphingomonadales bacterium]|nr:hypothetical protein [Sphingomonadales bacterium]
MIDDQPDAETPPQTCALCGCTDASPCHDDLRGHCWWVADRLCSHCAQPDPRRSLALVAAVQLSEVVAELLRFSREGDQEAFEPFALEPAENAADALRAILCIQRATAAPPYDLEREDEDNRLIGAIDCFLDGWA